VQVQDWPNPSDVPHYRCGETVDNHRPTHWGNVNQIWMTNHKIPMKQAIKLGLSKYLTWITIYS
jgi:hypothetical protein